MKLILITLVAVVVGMMVACEEKAPPTPSGPMYSEQEAIAMLMAHLQPKMFVIKQLLNYFIPLV